MQGTARGALSWELPWCAITARRRSSFCERLGMAVLGVQGGAARGLLQCGCWCQPCSDSLELCRHSPAPLRTQTSCGSCLALGAVTVTAVTQQGGDAAPHHCPQRMQQLLALPWLCGTQPHKGWEFWSHSKQGLSGTSLGSVAGSQPAARAGLVCVLLTSSSIAQ